MRQRLTFLIAYFLFWVLFFLCFRGTFLVYNAEHTSQLPWNLIGGIFLYGSRLDLSTAAYICLFPFFVIALSVFIPENLIKKILMGYTLIMVGVFSFLGAADLGIFQGLGYRLDAMPLRYLNTPKELIVVSGSSPYVLLISIIILFSVGFGYLFKKMSHTLLGKLTKAHPAGILLFLFLTATLIIPIRGGLQQIPINPSFAYFSTNDFANQAAINASRNMFDSLINKAYETTNPYLYMDQERAETIVHGLYQRPAKGLSPAMISLGRPNVLLIIWESFTAKGVSVLGGVPEVTPEFNRLVKKGMLFRNFYANADRSDKGLAAILSGYPPQPERSVIRIETKTRKLPALSKTFGKLGYGTSFYYGGELEFAHIRSYLGNSGFDSITAKEHFDPGDYNSKWGVHDHILLARVLSDLDDAPEPFFSTIFTLSSHEPFDVPVPTVIAGEDMDSKFLNSLHYTDAVVGDFLKQAASKSWYENTIVIILADHGHPNPGGSVRHDKKKFHVPMLWLGGALNVKGKVVDKVCSQTDLAATLLGQMGLDAREYRWSKDIFNPRTPGFAQYVFIGGMGYVKEQGSLSFDTVGKFCLFMDPSLSEEDLDISKAHLQVTYQDFLDL